MPYCTKEQVASEFSGVTFSSSSNPTTTEVEGWITQADALINSKVGLRYRVPITDTTDLLVISLISIMLVSQRVRRRLNRTGPDGDTARVKITDTNKDAMAMLNDIVVDKLRLPGSTLANSNVGVGAFSTSLECPHKFKRDTDAW